LDAVETEQPTFTANPQLAVLGLCDSPRRRLKISILNTPGGMPVLGESPGGIKGKGVGEEQARSRKVARPESQTSATRHHHEVAVATFADASRHCLP
jgi:hypothetical protein